MKDAIVTKGIQIRCPNEACGKRLFDADSRCAGFIQIKCPHCKLISSIDLGTATNNGRHLTEYVLRLTGN